MLTGCPGESRQRDEAQITESEDEDEAGDIRQYDQQIVFLRFSFANRRRVSAPEQNMSRIKPSWYRNPRTTLALGEKVNSFANTAGASNLSAKGPRMMPARISPTILGCLRRSER